MLNSTSSLRALIIDDNEDLAQIFATLFEVIGCTSELAGSGEKGLKIANQNIPHLIFCDLYMPGEKNGFDVAREIRADQRFDATWLIAVTGAGGQDIEEQAKAAGFDRIYLKPIRFAQLTVLINDYLASSR